MKNIGLGFMLLASGAMCSSPLCLAQERPRRPTGSTRPAVDAIASGQLALAAGLEQKPGARLSLIDPDLEQTCARHVALLGAKRVRFT